MSRKALITSVCILCAIILGVARPVLSDWFFPVQQMMAHIGSGAHGGVSALFLNFFSRHALSERVAELEAERLRLWEMIFRLETGQSLMRTLEDTAHFVHNKEFSFVSAAVFAASSNVPSELRMDAGSDDGISVGDRVVSSYGSFIGMVSAVTSKSAMIDTLSKETLSVKVTRKGSMEAIGVTAGGGPIDIQIRFVPKSIDLETGEMVYAYDELAFPTHLPIGVVSDVRPSQDALFQDVTVTLVTAIPQLQVASVLTTGSDLE